MTNGKAQASALSSPLPSPFAYLYDGLAELAEVLDDLERVRIANGNRASARARDGLVDDVVTELLSTSAVAIKAQEDRVTLQLKRTLRVHPLGPWVKAQHGLGEKTIARLLGAIGDPYWNSAAGRPRRGPAELWAYCGLHTHPILQTVDNTQCSLEDGTQLPSDQVRSDSRMGTVTGSTTGVNPGQYADDIHTSIAWVAARRQRGQPANWNANARKILYVIAEVIVKTRESPYRVVYDARKLRTEGRLHAVDCARCGPSGSPAKAGEPWSDAHRHADAMRIVAKEVLKDLWREARRMHVDPTGTAALNHALEHGTA